LCAGIKNSRILSENTLGVVVHIQKQGNKEEKFKFFAEPLFANKQGE
jgi:hypothetical protein